MKTLATNRHARHDYAILETFEAGIVLTGQEVKSVKNGAISLKGAHVIMRNNEAWLLNATVSPYPHAGPLPDYDPTRSRKLLLERSEIGRIAGGLSRDRLTVVPLEVYTHRGLVKIKIALARGLREHEKRESIKKKDVAREIRRHQF